MAFLKSDKNSSFFRFASPDDSFYLYISKFQTTHSHLFSASSKLPLEVNNYLLAE